MFKPVIAICVALVSTSAFPCTPIPLEWRDDFFNDATTRLLTQENISILEVNKLSVTASASEVVSYEWIRTDPGFQCHDKETLKTTLAIAYEKSELVGCTLTGTITKTEHFYENAPKTTYVVEDVTNLCE